MSWKQLWAALPLAGLIMLSGCGDHLVAPSPGNGTSADTLSALNRSPAKTMSVQISAVRGSSDAKLVKIFDNLAVRPSGTYWGGVRFVIVGGSGNQTFVDNQVAAAFTPSANHTATKVEAAIANSGLSYGSTGFILSINQDDNGLPGKALLTAQLPGLPYNYPGLCCVMVIGNIPSGLPLTGGQQYWLVLDGQSAPSSDGAGWYLDDTDEVHPFLDAVYCAYSTKCPNGPGWYAVQGTPYGTGAAFAVLGSK